MSITDLRLISLINLEKTPTDLISKDSIASAYKACIECFNRLCSIEETTVDTHAPIQIPACNTNVSNELARLRIWAANCGAHHPAHFRYSLDYRLRGSSHAKKMILQGLEMLKLFLQQGEWDCSLHMNI